MRLPDPMLSRPGMLPPRSGYGYEVKWGRVPRDRLDGGRAAGAEPPRLVDDRVGELAQPAAKSAVASYRIFAATKRHKRLLASRARSALALTNAWLIDHAEAISVRIDKDDEVVVRTGLPLVASRA